jgi:hypothetical protein
VQQNTQVLTVNTVGFAHFPLVTFFEENHTEQITVPGRQFFEHHTNLVSPFGTHKNALSVRHRPYRFTIFLGYRIAVSSTVKLTQYVLAYGVYKSAEPLGTLDTAIFSDRGQHPKEGFLAGIFAKMGTTEAAPQLQMEHLAEICGEMTLCSGITVSKALNVRSIEALELHASSCGTVPIDLKRALFGHQ